MPIHMVDAGTMQSSVPWPTHADGRPKKIGEMSPVELDDLCKGAAGRLQGYLNQPHIQKALSAVMKRARANRHDRTPTNHKPAPELPEAG